MLKHEVYGDLNKYRTHSCFTMILFLLIVIIIISTFMYLSKEIFLSYSKRKNHEKKSCNNRSK